MGLCPIPIKEYRRTKMLKKMKNFVKQKNICVLSTISGNKPYCSLMAYITDEDCKEIYMVTHKHTTKFNNLQNNPWVSLLIDSRETQPRSDAHALTINGVFVPLLDEGKKQKIRENMLKYFPHMKDFIHHPESEFIRIKINSLLLLEGLTQSHFVSL
jgi:general stress protein 26